MATPLVYQRGNWSVHPDSLRQAEVALQAAENSIEAMF
jgi:hypothetical protein